MLPIFFDLLSLVYGLQSVRVVITLVRTWRSFWDHELTPADRQLVPQVSFFLIIPLGVLLHEFGHAIATRMVGGEVLKFQWRLFWGYVVPAGDFTSAQDWWISLSGNLISVLFGLVLVAGGYFGRGLRRPLRYLLLDAGRFQTLYALVGYPLLSFIGFMGDWVSIYDFGRTPMLSTLTAIVHLAVLGGFWSWWRSAAVQERVFALAHNAEGVLARFRRAIAAAPEQVETHLALAEYFVGHGAVDLAEATLRKALRQCGEDGRVYLALGRCALLRGRHPPALEFLQRGLEVGVRDPRDEVQLWANLGIALVNEGRSREALDAFARVGRELTDDPVVRYWRGVARRNVGDVEAARADFEALTRVLPADHPLAGRARGYLEES